MVTTKFYLDKRSVKSGGYPLKIRISVKREAAYISLDLTLPAEQWDPVRQAVKKNCSNARKLNEYISIRKAQIDECIRGLILDGSLSHATAISVRDAVINKMYDHKISVSFLEHYESFKNSHKNPRTIDIYKSAESKMKAFDCDLEILKLEDINKKWLNDFSDWMSNSGEVCINTKNLYLRCIRACINNAIDNDLISTYAFRKFKMKNVETRKRSLSPEDLMSIFSAEVSPHKQKYIDTFKLIFLLIGINIADLLNLKKSDYNNGRITYYRHKTNRLYDIIVLPEAKEIIDRYQGSSNLLVFTEGRKSYRAFANSLNTCISEINKNVTSYYARHSWATIAASLDIPKETIAAALGHGSHSVTDIYINFDTKKVDEANRKVIDWVLYGKRD